jgi:hypothetical protein
VCVRTGVCVSVRVGGCGCVRVFRACACVRVCVRERARVLA